jgi:DNA-directed RNA polymerase specialized sigma24 family protein
VQRVRQKQQWELSSKAFESLLHWLDQGTDSGGESYLEMRRRLVNYFDRKNCLAPEDLTDETLNRVTRRLEEEGNIVSDSPAQYCYIVARFVFMEQLRIQEKENAVQSQTEVISQTNESEQAIRETSEQMLDCLENCTEKLDQQNRQMILRYYFGKEKVKIENRRALAKELGITTNALAIRACRLRDKLEACVRECISKRMK